MQVFFITGEDSAWERNRQLIGIGPQWVFRMTQSSVSAQTCHAGSGAALTVSRAISTDERARFAADGDFFCSRTQPLVATKISGKTTQHRERL
jgi:hypothetical protein